MLEPFGLDASKSSFWQKGMDVLKGFIDELDILTTELGLDKTKQQNPVQKTIVTQLAENMKIKTNE